MLDGDQKRILIVSLLPYLCLALYDSQLHGKAREVPRLEQAIHGMMGVSFTTLLTGLLLDLPTVFGLAVVAFSLAALADEAGFHRALPRHERLAHYIAYASFAGFIAVALGVGAFA